MCPRLSANYVSCCPPNMAQVSVWADNLHYMIKLYIIIMTTNKLYIVIHYFTSNC